ncbi:MAG: hypothetical protein JRF63_08610 [Deltaproteobacteria bacterium]|nr:hypothetical protein [Deltaproteobacteria bacterium]
MTSKRSSYVLFAASLLIPAAQIHATSMLKMDLADLTLRAERIFRGTVISVEQGAIEAGGGELPAVTYRFEVEELYKGEASQVKGDRAIIEIRMVGSLKKEAAAQDGSVRFSLFRDVPRFDEGGDHLLFTTPESAIGLSTTVGLGQGAFKVFPVDGVYRAVNEFNNAGLDLNGAGPVEYEMLRARIRALLGR